MNAEFPAEIEYSFYRDMNSDLSHIDDEGLLRHYIVHGKKEGRIATGPMIREGFLPIIDTTLPTLEIGPFYAPAVRGENVCYFDVLDQSDLKKRALKIEETADPPFIQYVSPVGDLSIVDRRFANVVSSHCIEHQPDLIMHLQKVAEILERGGRYFLIIPDKRYCFDHFIPETTFADVLGAHHEQRTVHSLTSVLEHKALVTHNDAVRHWAGDHEDPDYRGRLVPRAISTMQEFDVAKGTYIDVHAWQFTPDGFRTIIEALHKLGKTTLLPERIYNTPRDRFEFTAILRKP